MNRLIVVGIAAWVAVGVGAHIYKAEGALMTVLYVGILNSLYLLWMTVRYSLLSEKVKKLTATPVGSDPKRLGECDVCGRGCVPKQVGDMRLCYKCLPMYIRMGD